MHFSSPIMKIDFNDHTSLPISDDFIIRFPRLSNLDHPSKIHFDMNLSKSAIEILKDISDEAPYSMIARKISILPATESVNLLQLFLNLEQDGVDPMFHDLYVLPLQEKTKDYFDAFDLALNAIVDGQTDVRSPGFSFKMVDGQLSLKLSPTCSFERLASLIREKGLEIKNLHWEDDSSYETHATDLTWLTHFSGIKHLYIDSPSLLSLRGINSQGDLTSLHLSKSWIRSPEEAELASLSKLEELVISNVRFDDMSFFADLVLLKNLFLKGLVLSSLEPFSRIPNLKSLTMEATGAAMHPSEWKELSKFKSIEFLELMDCRVPNLKWINGCEELKYLKCYNCHQLKSLQPLLERSPLETLDLRGCENISPMDWERILEEKKPAKAFGPGLFQHTTTIHQEGHQLKINP